MLLKVLNSFTEELIYDKTYYREMSIRHQIEKAKSPTAKSPYGRTFPSEISYGKIHGRINSSQISIDFSVLSKQTILASKFPRTILKQLNKKYC